MFPPDYGKMGPLEPTSPVPRCDSVASSATIPMRLEEPLTPGGGRTLHDVEDEVEYILLAILENLLSVS